MLENILLAIVMTLQNVEEYFVGYCLAISECWRIFFGYCLAISECWRICCWLVSLLLVNLVNIL